MTVPVRYLGEVVSEVAVVVMEWPLIKCTPIIVLVTVMLLLNIILMDSFRSHDGF